MVDERVEIELLAKDFASQVFKKVGTTAEKEGKKASRSLDAVDRTSKKLTASLGRLTAGFLGVGAAVLAVRRGAQAFLDFNRAFTEVQTILGDTGAEVQGLEQQILDLSLAFGENEAVVARGFYQTLSAGITDAAEATEVLRVSTELAVGGLTSVATAVDAITTVLNGYGLAAGEAQAISDVLFKSVELGKTRVDELGSSLGQVVPFAAQLGVSFEEASASVVQLTKVGLSTSEAVTQVRSAIVGLLKNASDLDELFRQRLGRGFTVADVRSRGLIRTLQDLTEATGGSEVELVKLLGRVEAVGATLTLTADGARGVTEVFEELQNSSGAAAAASSTVLDSTAKKLEILQTGLRQGFGNLAGEILEPITELGDAFGGASEAAAGLRDAIGLATRPAQILLGTVGAVAAGFGAAALAALALKDAAGFDVAEDEAQELIDSLTILSEATRNLLTGGEDFTASEIIGARRRREARAQEAEEIERLLETILRASTAGTDQSFTLAPDVDLEEVNEKLALLETRAEEAGVRIDQILRRRLSGTGVAVEQFAAQLSAVGIELDIGGSLDGLQVIRAEAELLREDLEALGGAATSSVEIDFAGPSEEVRALAAEIRRAQEAADEAALAEYRLRIGVDPDVFVQVARIRARLEEAVGEAQAAGEQIDTALVRDVAISVGLDPDALIESLDLAADEALRQLEGFSRRVQDVLQVDLSEALTFENAESELGQQRQRIGTVFTRLAREAAEAGAQIPDGLLGPLLDSFVLPQYRADFRAELERIAEDARAAGGEIAEGLNAAATDADATIAITPELNVEQLKRDLSRLKAQEAILSLRVELGETGELGLLINRAEQARLAFVGMAQASDLLDSELSEAIAAVDRRLRAQIAQTDEARATLELLFPGATLAAQAFSVAIAGVATEVDALGADAARAQGAFVSLTGSALDFSLAAVDALAGVGPGLAAIVTSQEAVARITAETLGPFEAERQAILDLAAGWRASAAEREDATDPTVLQAEIAAIDETEAALLRRLEAQRRVVAAQDEAQIIGLEAEAGIRSRAAAANAAAEAEVAHFQALADTGEITQENADRARTAILAQLEAERALARVQNESRIIGLEIAAGFESRATAQVAAIDAEIAALRAEADAGKITEEQLRRAEEAAEGAREAATTFVGRFRANLADLEESVSGAGIADQVFGGFESAIDSASRALVDSEASFAEWRDAVLEDFARILIRIGLTQAALAAFNALGLKTPATDSAEASKSAAVLSGAGFVLKLGGDSVTTGATAMAATIPASFAMGIAGLAIKTGADKLEQAAIELAGAAALLLAAGFLGGGGVAAAEGGVVGGKLLGVADAGGVSFQTTGSPGRGSSPAPAPARFFAEGGIMPGPMRGFRSASAGANTLPERRYAFGGIADSPQLAIFGEGSGAEAFVPLGADRKIPVRIESDASVQRQETAAQQNVEARFEINVSSLDAKGSAAAVAAIMPQVMEQFAATLRSGGRGSRDAIESIRHVSKERG